MIEKFTPEELAQIRQELKAMDQTTQKASMLGEQFRRVIGVLGIKADDELSRSFSAFDVKNAMTLRCDHAMKNYELNRRKTRANQRVWKRTCSVPAGKEDRYLECYTKLVDVLEKYSEPWPGDSP